LFDAARVAAGIDEWPDNALRHSFASYHVAHFKDAKSLALEMGHIDSGMLFNNYRALVKPAEAERYWEIRPTPAAKIYPMVPKPQPARANLDRRVVNKVLSLIAACLFSASAFAGEMGECDVEIEPDHIVLTANPYAPPKPGDPLYDAAKESELCKLQSDGSRVIRLYRAGVFYAYAQAQEGGAQ
jgi:hypothetical protein